MLSFPVRHGRFGTIISCKISRTCKFAASSVGKPTWLRLNSLRAYTAQIGTTIEDADAALRHSTHEDDWREMISKGRQEGRKHLLDKGYDPTSFHEHEVVWGELDSFRHVNNVNYVRFLESSRIRWMRSVALDLGGPQRVSDMISGKGISLILKQIEINYRRPVTYPDTLVIGHAPHNLHTTQFSNRAMIYSYAQRAVVATSDSVIVWYDYDHLKKCDPGETARAVLEKRICNRGAKDL